MCESCASSTSLATSNRKGRCIDKVGEEVGAAPAEAGVRYTRSLKGHPKGKESPCAFNTSPRHLHLLLPFVLDKITQSGFNASRHDVAA
jgi:hypothetical protein